MTRFYAAIAITLLSAAPAAAVQLVPVDLELTSIVTRDFAAGPILASGVGSLVVPWDLVQGGAGSGTYTLRTDGNALEMVIDGSVSCPAGTCSIGFPEFAASLDFDVPDFGETFTSVLFSYLPPLVSPNIQTTSIGGLPITPVALAFRSYSSSILPGAPVALDAVFSDISLQQSHILHFLAGDSPSISTFARANNSSPILSFIFDQSGPLSMTVRLEAWAILPEPGVALLLAGALLAVRTRIGRTSSVLA